MSEAPEWFAPKRYGYGAGRPISWQGWTLTLGYVAAVIVASLRFSDRPLVLLAICLPLTFLLIVIAGKTTKGGWSWRWGSPD